MRQLSAVSIRLPPCRALSRFGDREPPGERGVRDVGHHLDRDVRQPGHRHQVVKLGGHGFGRAGAAPQRGLIDQEPCHRRRGLLAGQDDLACQPRGETLGNLLVSRAGERPEQGKRVRLGLQQSRQ